MNSRTRMTPVGFMTCRIASPAKAAAPSRYWPSSPTSCAANQTRAAAWTAHSRVIARGARLCGAGLGAGAAMVAGRGPGLGLAGGGGGAVGPRRARHAFPWSGILAREIPVEAVGVLAVRRLPRHDGAGQH